MTFADWVALPENRAGRAAITAILADLAPATRRTDRPLLLHGPAGTGKTHLMRALVAEATARVPDLTVCLLGTDELTPLLVPASEDRDAPNGEEWSAAGQADLLIVEDLQHLPARGADGFARLLDRGRARGQIQVATASVGPARLTHLPARLTSRLAAGLVVGLEALGRASRLEYLRVRAKVRGVNASEVQLAWLAGQIPGSARQLDGALGKLGDLLRLEGAELTEGRLQEVFSAEAEASRPTPDRIARRVGQYFRVDPRQLRARRRHPSALLPRQVGMYLARQLTGLTLRQIGAYFGGHDHSTVLHACRKIEQALGQDDNLSGAVRQLHADLM